MGRRLFFREVIPFPEIRVAIDLVASVGFLETVQLRFLFRLACAATRVTGSCERIFQQGDGQQDGYAPDQDHPHDDEQHAAPAIEHPTMAVRAVHVVLSLGLGLAGKGQIEGTWHQVPKSLAGQSTIGMPVSNSNGTVAKADPGNWRVAPSLGES